ncbi:MAG: hypothetical protein AAF741_03570 [Bacteroidota bacterium]
MLYATIAVNDDRFRTDPTSALLMSRDGVVFDSIYFVINDPFLYPFEHPDLQGERRMRFTGIWSQPDLLEGHIDFGYLQSGSGNFVPLETCEVTLR